MNATDIPQCCDAVSSFSNNLHAFAEGGTAVMANAGEQRRCSAMVGYCVLALSAFRMSALSLLH